MEYLVCAEIKIIVHVEVDADSESEAMEVAKELIYNGECEYKELVDEPDICWAEENDHS